MPASLSSWDAERAIGTAAESRGLGYDAPTTCWWLPPFRSSRYMYGMYSQVTGSSNVTVSLPVLKSSCGLRASTGGAVSRTIVRPCQCAPVLKALPAASARPRFDIVNVPAVLPARLLSYASWSAGVSVTVTSVPRETVMFAPACIVCGAAPAAPILMWLDAGVPESGSVDLNRNSPAERSSVGASVVSRPGASRSLV